MKTPLLDAWFLGYTGGFITAGFLCALLDIGITPHFKYMSACGFTCAALHLHIALVKKARSKPQ